MTLQTLSLATAQNTERLPAPLVNRWQEMQSTAPAKFSNEKAMQCFAFSSGDWQSVNPQTVEQAMAVQAPTLGAMATYLGDGAAVQVVAEMITAAALLLNVGKNIRQEQVYPIAEIITSENKHLTVADFRAAMRMGVTGKFGATYDRLDVTVISEWCTKYFDIRCSTGEGKAIVANNGNKTNGKEMPMPAWMVEFSNSLTAKVEAKKAASPTEPDAPMLAWWKSEWDAMPEGARPTWEAYKGFQTAKLKRNG